MRRDTLCLLLVLLLLSASCGRFSEPPEPVTLVVGEGPHGDHVTDTFSLASPCANVVFDWSTSTVFKDGYGSVTFRIDDANNPHRYIDSYHAMFQGSDGGTNSFGSLEPGAYYISVSSHLTNWEITVRCDEASAVRKPTPDPTEEFILTMVPVMLTQVAPELEPLATPEP